MRHVRHHAGYRSEMSTGDGLTTAGDHLRACVQNWGFPTVGFPTVGNYAGSAGIGLPGRSSVSVGNSSTSSRASSTVSPSMRAD